MAKAGFAKDQLKSFIDRIERLNEEREALSADIREVFAEAKGTGFDKKIMRQVIRMRKLDKADFQEQEAMLDLYLTGDGNAVGTVLTHRECFAHGYLPKLLLKGQKSLRPIYSSLRSDHQTTAPRARAIVAGRVAEL